MALARKPAGKLLLMVPTLLDLALQQHQAGNLNQAEQFYRQILLMEPNNAEALHLLGVIASQRGRHDLAVPFIQQALGVMPSSPVFHNNLGVAFESLGKFSEAAFHYRRFVELRPDDAMAHCNLGAVLQAQSKNEEAEHCLREALRLQPHFARALTVLGNALAGQGKPEDAIACYRQALGLEPNFIDANINLGFALSGQGHWQTAVACYRRALELKSDSVAAHIALGSALAHEGKKQEATAAFRRGLQLQPDNAELHCYLGTVLSDPGDAEEAIACYRRGLQLAPENPAVLSELVRRLQTICRWDYLNEPARQIIEAVEKEAPCPIGAAVAPLIFLGLPTPTTAQQQLQCARQWVERRLQRAVRAGEHQEFSRPPRARSRITVGFLSSDFQIHPVSFLIAELIEKLNRQRFEVLAYSYGPDDGSSLRRRLGKAFDRFVDLQDASHVDAAKRIHDDEVDILIDLNGHTTTARTPILAFRPAPLQVHYLGYPGTMGAPFMDYILVDDFVVPPEHQPFFTEKLVYLPGCYQVNDSQRAIAAHTPARAECGLPEAGFIFCSFHDSFKITAEVFEVWMQLLKAVPASVLWLLETNRLAAANLRGQAQARGVAPERLVFAPLAANADHLARYRLADLVLDTWPYNGHSTASDALWAGCPVLTLAGQTFPARVAGSLLRTVGPPELITGSLPEYKEMALRLAWDADLLSGLRARLNANRATSPLFSGEQFARGLERALETMYSIHASGEQPRSFIVPTADA
jgi:protein O-GlcNAc transferase